MQILSRRKGRTRISQREWNDRCKRPRPFSPANAKLALDILFLDLPFTLETVEIRRTTRFCFMVRIPGFGYLLVVPLPEQERTLMELGVLPGPFGWDSVEPEPT